MNKHALAGLVIVLLAVLGIYIAADNYVSESSTEYVFESGTFTYPKGNFALSLPDGWAPADVSAAVSPGDIRGGRFALKKSGTSCTILYAHTPRTTIEIPPLKQVSFGERVHSEMEKSQWDSSWWIHERNAPANLAFSDFRRQPLPGEMRITQHPQDIPGDTDTTRIFVLYDERGDIVLDDCDREFSQILQSFRFVYDSTTISDAAEGELYIRSFDNEPPRVLFRGNDGIAREVLRIETSPIAYGYIVRGTELYGSTGQSLIGIDVFTKKMSASIALPISETEHIIDVLMIGNRIWYLAANPQCTDLGNCTADIYESDFDGPAARVATGVQASWILGYDSAENALYFRSGYGDAGCFSAIITRYAFVAGTAQRVASVGGCAEEPGYAEAAAELKKYTERFTGQSMQATHALVQNASLIPPGNDGLPDGGTTPLRFMEK